MRNDSLTAPEELKQEEEDVDDVHVETESAKHVLLRAQRVAPIPHQQLHVERQELHPAQKHPTQNPEKSVSTSEYPSGH